MSKKEKMSKEAAENQEIKDKAAKESNIDSKADEAGKTQAENADVNKDSAGNADTDSKNSENADSEADDASDAGKADEPGKVKDPKDAVIADLQDRVKRQMAEFDNFRKRTDKEKSAMFEMGASDVIKKLLPVVDNFERGFKSLTEDEKNTPFAQGMEMVYKQTMKMLEDLEVRPIEAVGKEFNPDIHNAVMHIEDDSVGDGIIVEEFEKGYTYRESVVRHSMVKVAN